VTPARRTSAGVLLFRSRPELQVLLGHMGGPFWARKDAAAWSIPKGEYDSDEAAFDAARREFAEELGPSAPIAAAERYLDLGPLRASGKSLRVWALDGDFDPAALVSNTFELEWPPRSGIRREFPEFDRAAWFALPEARTAIVRGQLPYLDRLVDALGDGA
jgi:predicted NUDIX family NTP pyrophosphohydrolase